MKKEKLDPTTVPADGSSIKYTLIRVLEKNKSKEFLLDDIWTVKSINGEMIEILKTENDNENHELVLAIDLLEMKILGYDGCNNFFGSIETPEQNVIDFKILGATKMVCPDMEIPLSYKNALMKTHTFKLTDDSLYFYDVGENQVLKFQKAE